MRNSLARVHRVCRIHTSWIPEYVTGTLESRLLLRLQKKSCHLAQVVVSPSRHMATHYAQSVLQWTHPVRVNPNPLKLWHEPFRWEEKSPHHLLFVGRIEYRKGLDLLLQVLESMGEKSRPFVLRIIGAKYPPDNAADKACQNALERALANSRHALGFQIDYLGPVAHAELHRHYDWAGIAILPSRQDNFPYTALEALSRGCFVLASNVGGLPETLEGCQGQLFKSEDPDDLGEKMGELAQNGDRVRKSWLSNAQVIAERFHAEVCYLRLMQTYAGPNGTPESSVLPR